MSDTKFFAIMVAYVLLLAATGYITFVQSPKLATLPGKEMIDRAARDSLYKSELALDIKGARDRREQLVKEASHAFSVVLGALLGFLSAVAATTKPASDSGVEGDAGNERQVPRPKPEQRSGRLDKIDD